MSTSNYPTTIDAPATSTPTETVAAFDHSGQHNLLGTAVVKIQSKLGTGSNTTPVINKLLRGTSATASDWDTTAPTGTIVGTTDMQPLSNKTITASTIDDTNTVTQKDTLFTLENGADTTKKLKFQLSGITTATTRTKTVQDLSGTLYETGGVDVAIADGGTGQSTATAGFNALSPLTTKGDIVGFDGSNNVRLAPSTNGLVLTLDSTQTTGLKWGAPSASNIISENPATQTGPNTNVETTLYTVAIPGGTLGTASAIDVYLAISSQTINSGNGGVYRIKYGGTTLATITVTTATGNTTGIGTITGKIYANAATNAQKGMFVSNIKSGQTDTTQNGYGTSAIDSTTSQNLLVTYQGSNNATIDGIIVTQV